MISYFIITININNITNLTFNGVLKTLIVFSHHKFFVKMFFHLTLQYTDMPLFRIVPEFRIYDGRTIVVRTNGFHYAKCSNKIRKW